MADLTATEQAKVKCWTGYSRLDGTIDPYLVDLSAEEYALVQALIADIEAAVTASESALATSPYKRVEEVEWWGRQGIQTANDEAARLVRKLASFLGIVVAENLFGGGGITSAPICRG